MESRKFEVIKRNGRDRLGEGPVWLERRGELAWVDIIAPAIHRLDLAQSRVATIPMDEAIGWIIPRANESSVVVGLRSGFWIMDLNTGKRFQIGAPEIDRPNNRLNDAKVDHAGRIWAGSKDNADECASGALYRLDADLSHCRLDDGYQVTNGPTFSLDGSIMYHTDSAERTIYAFNLDSEGQLSNKRIWLRFEDEWGYPDGMTTDSDGCLWIAHWDGAKISRFDPEGRRISWIDLPASNITSCAFGGDDLSRLFVTSSTIGREEEPLAGSLFEVDPGVRGAPQRAFAG